jgi:hypothetical protein
VFFKQKSRFDVVQNPEEWLRAVPQKNCQYFKESDGNITLKMPRAENEFLLRIINIFSKEPFFKIKLDDRGSYIWQYCNGEKTIQEISLLLEQHYGDDVKPAKDRTIFFFKQLYQNKLIKFYHHETS